jgi:hypothetical protein
VRRLAASLLAAGCVLAATACGGGGSTKTVDVADYASSVCSALRVWQEHIREGSNVLVTRIDNEDDLSKVREQLVIFYGDAVTETDAMIKKVEKAGAPELAQGNDLSDELLDRLRRFPPLIQEAQTKAGELPVDNERVFATKAQALGAEYRTESIALSTLFDELARNHAAPQFTQATTKNATCTQFREQAAFG